MIKAFSHKGLEKFYLSGSVAGIQPIHEGRLKALIFALDHARNPRDMNAPKWGRHLLKGTVNRYAVKVDKNWRLTFEFDGIDAVNVDYEDYHSGR